MTLTPRIAKSAKRFAKAQRGSTAVIFAISLVPILMAAGAAIDFLHMYTVRNHLQAALDAGSLAGAVATGKTDAQRIQIAKDTFNANMNASDLADSHTTVTFTMGDTTMSGTAGMQVPMELMALAGFSNMDLNTNSEIKLPSEKNAEIVFVLDYSGSMLDVAGTQVKYVAMRDAVTKLVNNLTAQSPDKLKFGLVPFSDQVLTDIPKPYVYGQTGAGTWTGCTLDNPSPYNLQDTPPTAGDSSKWNQPTPGWLWTSACSGYAARHLKIRPLSNDFSGLKSQIASMTPYANTHISLGVQFGFQALSPNGIYNGGGNVAAYSDSNTIKYLVLLTDGMQTEAAFGPGNSRSVADGEDNLVSICNNVKGAGIHVMTMAVGVNDVGTSTRLQNCTTDASQDFFAIDTTDDMAQAFATITSQIAAQAYVSK